MKAVQYARRGAPDEVLECVELDAAPMGPGDLRIAIEAAPINYSVLMTVTGEYGMLPDLPATPGFEGVGRIVEIGSDVTGYALGERIMLLPSNGTWCDEIVVAAGDVIIRLPNDADPVQLSMMMANPMTAWRMLKDFADLGPGDWVIQNAGNSAVGGYLIQLAHAWGLRTVNVVRRDGLEDDLSAMGADVVIVDGDDLAADVTDATDGADIAVGIDAIGGPATGRLANCLARAGTVVSYGLLSGEPCEMAPADIIFREISLTGFWLNLWLRNPANASDRAAIYAEIATMIAAGTLSATVEATYPLDDIKQAANHALQRGRAGKIVLVPQSSSTKS